MTTRSLSERVRERLLDLTLVRILPSRNANLIQCRSAGLWNRYFEQAEASIDTQWETIIWPLIQDFDFSVVLELSPGAGRNTAKLCAHARRLIAVDYNEYALEQAEARLGRVYSGCAISYHRNNGRDLAMVADGAVTAVYCWDSAVHFDRDVLAGYIGEFARVLQPGGRGFLHHSDLGMRAHKNIKRNPHWRSNADRELVASACRRYGLTVLKQQAVPWGQIEDCVTVFSREVDRAATAGP
jgi:ubiquinone/menaquinone biosynthesis C-methylase UbiE